MLSTLNGNKEKKNGKKKSEDIPPRAVSEDRGRRKISLPWFRQVSFGTSSVKLPRQHTIDTPFHYRARSVTSSSSQFSSSDVCGVSFVLADYNSSAGTSHLSVTRGQQVEILETHIPHAPDCCMVRVPCTNASDPPFEGLLPISILRGSPSACRARDVEADGAVAGPSTSSPITKRRGFSGRKWLPPPLRKLSQGKSDKTPKKDKKLKTPSVSDEAGPSREHDDAEDEVELPPPMKPISEPLLVQADDHQPCVASGLTANGTSADLAEIEQIVKEKVEQHGADTAEQDKIAIQKREYVLRELIESERDYVKYLGMVVDEYLGSMKSPKPLVSVPQSLKGGKCRLIFSNIPVIYEFHRDSFLKALESCITNPVKLGPIFKKYERKLLCYIIYCQNKPVSEFIISENSHYFEQMRHKLGHKLQICDLLIKPVQRITKYQLLLKDLLKYTEKAHLVDEIESMKQAITVMQIVPKAANDMMDVGRLRGFEGKVNTQGKVLLHGVLYASESTPGFLGGKVKEYRVFLFEQSMVFSEELSKKSHSHNPMYIYRNHLQLNKLSLDDKIPGDGKLGLFLLRSTDPNKPPLAYYCQALSMHERYEWVNIIEGILKTQREFLRALQSPISYQKQLSKKAAASAE